MKVAIYARVSRKDQKLDTQVSICTIECGKKGYEIFNVYKDVISGKTSSRLRLNQLLQDMRENKFDAIMVTKLDRIGRSLKHLLSLFDEFQSKGISFIAVTQNIDTSTAAGRLQMQIMGAFAEFERNIISERTKEGLMKKKEGKRGPDKKPRKRRGVLKRPLNYFGG